MRKTTCACGNPRRPGGRDCHACKNARDRKAYKKNREAERGEGLPPDARPTPTVPDAQSPFIVSSHRPSAPRPMFSPQPDYAEKGHEHEASATPPFDIPRHPLGGAPPEVEAEPTLQERLEITRLRAELSREKVRAREAEKAAVTGDAVRALVGSLSSPHITANPAWLKGASEPRSVTGTPVLMLSDIHFDEVVRADQIGGSNEYNREIATRSLRNTFHSAIRLLKGHMARPRYDGIVLALGGDLLSGNIHEELIKTNEYPIQKSIIALEEILIEGLGGLADEFGKVHVPCVTGNHGRMSRKPEAKNRAAENFEWAVYQRMASYFRKDERITFDIPEGSDAMFTIYNKRFCLTHGDQFRGGDGIGGILVPIMRGVKKKQSRQVAIGDPFDVIMMGHWHQYIHIRSLIVNGSVKGYDEYAFQGNFDFEEPQQALFIVHPTAGVTCRWPVLCRYEGGTKAV